MQLTWKGKMKYFYAIVEKDEDSAFGVSFPDVQGCFSAADDCDDIVPNACEALRLWFENADEVEPSSLEAIKCTVAEELADGAFIISVPYLPAGNKHSHERDQ